jgi:hypothetical protein
VRPILLLSLFCCIAGAAEYTGPAENIFPRVPGTDVGVIGGIPAAATRGTPGGHTTIDVTQAPYSADNTGATNTRAAIQSAINAATTGDVVYLPAGTYRIDTQLTIPDTKDNFTIRGAGMTTIIDDRSADYAFALGTANGAQDYAWADQRYALPSTNNTVTAGLTAGSTILTIADTTDFTVGAIIQIALSNQMDNTAIIAGAVPTVSIAGYETLRRQLARVISKTGTTLTIFPAVHYTPDAGLVAKVNAQSTVLEGVGIEDMYIDNTNGGASGIFFQASAGCWVKNVKTYKFTNYPVYFENCINMEVRRCDFRTNKIENTSSNAGVLMNTVGNSIIEDNIIYRIFPAIEVNAGSQGNVIAYNWMYNEVGTCLDTNHGPHNSLNLYEGNIASNIKSDGYFGSQSHDTIYRNWLTGALFETSTYTFVIGMSRFSRKNVFVGNILGPGTAWPYGDSPISLGGSPFGGAMIGTAQPTANDFWEDWKMTGTLTTRTSDTSGVITLSTLGHVTTENFLTVWWASRAHNGQFLPSSIDGLACTFTFISNTDVLPAVSSTFEVYTGSGGYNEEDYDSYRTNDPTHPGSTTCKANYWAVNNHMHIPSSTANGGTDETLGGDTLADSWYTSKAGMEARGTVWGNLTFPPFDSASPGTITQAGWARIPAGYRYLNDGADPPAGGTLTITTFNVGN